MYFAVSRDTPDSRSYTRILYSRVSLIRPHGHGTLTAVHPHSLATRAYTPSSPLPAHSRSAAGGRRGRTRFACDIEVWGIDIGDGDRDGDGEKDRWRGR